MTTRTTVPARALECHGVHPWARVTPPKGLASAACVVVGNCSHNYVLLWRQVLYHDPVGSDQPI